MSIPSDAVCGTGVLSIGFGVRGFQGGYNACKFAPKKELDERYLCTRHYNLEMRNRRVREWKQAEQIVCPDHPSRDTKVFPSGQELFCSYPVETKPSLIFCNWRVAIPDSVWHGK